MGWIEGSWVGLRWGWVVGRVGLCWVGGWGWHLGLDWIGVGVKVGLGLSRWVGSGGLGWA